MRLFLFTALLGLACLSVAYSCTIYTKANGGQRLDAACLMNPCDEDSVEVPLDNCSTTAHCERVGDECYALGDLSTQAPQQDNSQFLAALPTSPPSTAAAAPTATSSDDLVGRGLGLGGGSLYPNQNPLYPPFQYRPPQKFPLNCGLNPSDPRIFALLNPPIDIPYCLRIPCSRRNPQMEKDRFLCHSQPGCYFDTELFQARYGIGITILPGVPVCHSVIRNKGFIKAALAAVSKAKLPWNGLYTKCFLKQNPTVLDNTCCDGLKVLSYFGAKSKLLGWRGISKYACSILGGCYKFGKCYFPPDFNQISIRSGEDKHRRSFSSARDIYGQPKCLDFNPKGTPADVLRDYHSCLSAGCVIDPAYGDLKNLFCKIVKSPIVPYRYKVPFWDGYLSGKVRPDNWETYLAGLKSNICPINFGPPIGAYSLNLNPSGRSIGNRSLPLPYLRGCWELGYFGLSGGSVGPVAPPGGVNPYFPLLPQSLQLSNNTGSRFLSQLGGHGGVGVPPYRPPGQGYPQPGPVYPQPGPVYPQPGPVYPQPGQGYPQPGPVYPQPGQGYPQPGPVYPQPGQGYPQPGPSPYQPPRQPRCPYRQHRLYGRPPLKGSFFDCCAKHYCYIPRPVYGEQSSGVAAYYSRYSSWGKCTKTCGNGQRTRRRSCIDTHGKGTCYGDDSQTASCNTNPCPYWGPYGDWSQCDAKCGGGSQRRTRECLPKGSTGCAGKSEEVRSCQTGACATYKYSSWSPCTAPSTGGYGEQTRSSICVQRGAYGCDPSIAGKVEKKQCKVFCTQTRSVGPCVSNFWSCQRVVSYKCDCQPCQLKPNVYERCSC